ncbi:hypothetical protein BBI11_15510 [Planococcus maritimus]|nr:hypothetical protein BBI11_15510 [Planococcus maritimus]
MLNVILGLTDDILSTLTNIRNSSKGDIIILNYDIHDIEEFEGVICLPPRLVEGYIYAYDRVVYHKSIYIYPTC